MTAIQKKRISRILFVDDDPNVLFSYRMAMEEKNVEILTSLSGADGFSQAVLNHINIIFVDSHMPDMDGFELCQRLKSDPRSADIPVIFITGNSNRPDRVKAFEFGAVDYLVKPIQLQKLRDEVIKHSVLS